MKYLVWAITVLVWTASAWAQESQSTPTGARDMVSLALEALDGKCLNIKTRPCVRPDPDDPVGIYLQYWEPVVFVETVKKPGDYVVWPQGLVVKALGPEVDKLENQVVDGGKDITPTSTSSVQSMDSSDLQFNEVHIYDYTLKELSDIMCPSLANNETQYRYASEGDSVLWRRGELGFSLQTIGTAAHNWGPLYPRTGFVIHANPAVASATAGMKALSIAATGGLHVVESRLDFQPDFQKDKIEMVYPQKSKCLSIGQNLRSAEGGNSSLINMTSKDGRYVWVYWHYRTCCRGIDF